jgi:voltage-gated potassium channel Kch
MDAAALVGGLKANMIIADAGMRTVTRLARVGADDVVLPVVARTLGDVTTSLGELASRDAQTLIGPGVNFASDAKLAVAALEKQAVGGVMPSHGSIAEALRRVELLAGRIDELA